MPSVVKKTKALKVAKEANQQEIVKSPKFVSDSLDKKQTKRKEASKTAKASKKGVSKVNLTKKKKRGIVYIKHLPHGFFEEQLKSYFTQFGAVTRLRLARSTRTLGSKGYAFIEFKYPEVAQIAAEAMNNYIMFKQIIKTAYIAPENVKFDYFRSGIRRTWVDDRMSMSSNAIEARNQIVEGNNRLMTSKDEVKRNKIIAKKNKKAGAKLADLGIEYDLAAINGQISESVLNTQSSATSMDIGDDIDESPINVSEINVESDDEVMDLDCSQNSADEDEDLEPKINVAAVKKAVKFAEDVKKEVELEQEASQSKKGKTPETKKVAPKSPATKKGKVEKANGQKKETKKKEAAAKKPALKQIVAVLEPEKAAENSNKAKKAGKKAKNEKLTATVDLPITTPEPKPTLKNKEKKERKAALRAPKVNVNEVPIAEKSVKVKKSKVKADAISEQEPVTVTVAPKTKKSLPTEAPTKEPVTVTVAPKTKKSLPTEAPTKEPQKIKVTKEKVVKVGKKKDEKIPKEKLKKTIKPTIQKASIVTEKPLKTPKSKTGQKAKK